MARKSLTKNPVHDSIGQRNYYCCRCGTAYSRQKGYFPASHSHMYRAAGYLPWCNTCVDKMYEEYREYFLDDRAAMRRMCMKLDLYWHTSLFDACEKTSVSNARARSYIGKTNLVGYIDKSFDDTIAEEEEAAKQAAAEARARAISGECSEEEREEELPREVPDGVRKFWGPGYTDEMYFELEDRREYWMSKYPNVGSIDIGEEALIRQICNLELQINHDRTAGKPIDKNISTLNSLLGSLNIKPNQKKEEADSALDSMTLGVGIWKWENTRPIPEPDPEFRDVNRIVWYISVFFLGHLCKMLHIKNVYCKMYEDEIARLRVERPEYEDEDDEEFFNDIFASADGGG